ncbi:hypothetical protein SynBOUM118_00458 [Synechococcus sp. BOUM118]|nr:hypothetical protein SynBOUM118_00458 [Synechococcus sp. BOUM118]
MELFRDYVLLEEHSKLMSLVKSEPLHQRIQHQARLIFLPKEFALAYL